MFEFYDNEIDEIEEERRRRIRRRVRDLTKADIDKMTNEISSMVEIAAPEVAIPEELLKEGIHVGNNS